MPASPWEPRRQEFWSDILKVILELNTLEIDKKLKNSKSENDSQTSSQIQILQIGSDMDYEHKYDVNSDYMEPKQYIRYKLYHIIYITFAYISNLA